MLQSVDSEPTLSQLHPKAIKHMSLLEFSDYSIVLYFLVAVFFSHIDLHCTPTCFNKCIVAVHMSVTKLRDFQ